MNIWDALIITPFVNVLLFIYNLVGQNFGIAIILFTILIRLITHPLTVQQLKGTQGMQNLQKDPRYIEMQKKYKGDRERLAQEQMKLYKELGINPFGACLPTLIQFPIIIGLYQSVIRALASSPMELLDLTKHLYPNFLPVSNLIPLHSNFLWMNLGKPDLIPVPGIPLIGGIPILAIIVVVTTYLQSKLMTPPSTGNDQGAQMGKMMNLYMPFLMGYLALTLASGLSLYFVASNIIGIAQYAALGKISLSSLLPLKKEEKQEPLAKYSISSTTKSAPSNSKPKPRLNPNRNEKGSANPKTRNRNVQKSESGDK